MGKKPIRVSTILPPATKKAKILRRKKGQEVFGLGVVDQRRKEERKNRTDQRKVAALPL
jgi:hypothetical protein